MRAHSKKFGFAKSPSRDGYPNASASCTNSSIPTSPTSEEHQKATMWCLPLLPQENHTSRGERLAAGLQILHPLPPAHAAVGGEGGERGQCSRRILTSPAYAHGGKNARVSSRSPNSAATQVLPSAKFLLRMVLAVGHHLSPEHMAAPRVRAAPKLQEQVSSGSWGLPVP